MELLSPPFGSESNYTNTVVISDCNPSEHKVCLFFCLKYRNFFLCISFCARVQPAVVHTLANHSLLVDVKYIKNGAVEYRDVYPVVISLISIVFGKELECNRGSYICKSPTLQL